MVEYVRWQEELSISEPAESWGSVSLFLRACVDARYRWAQCSVFRGPPPGWFQSSLDFIQEIGQPGGERQAIVVVLAP